MASAYDGIMLLRNQLAKYPPNYIQRCAIRKAVLVSSLTENNENYDGIATTDGTLYIVIDPTDWDCSSETIHHEIEHQAYDVYSREKTAIVFEKQIKKPLRRTTYLDVAWGQVHETHRIQYSGDGWSKRRNTNGFVRDYGSRDTHEDKATIMELLMTKPSELQEQCRTDVALSAKLTHMKRELERRTNGQMDEEYFNALASGTVDENYWK